MKVYKSFASKDARDKYICKSEIDKKLLEELGLLEFITVNESIKIFDFLCLDKNKSIVVKVGNKYKCRHTKYVKKSIFYQEIISRL